jgi:hypothetical protein
MAVYDQIANQLHARVRRWTSRGRTLLKPLVCLYHSRMLFNVDFRVKSNMKRIATASLETSGSIDTNSR